MKKIEVGQAINTLANLGVISGILFLAVELRQNNQMMLAQTRSDIAHNIAGAIREMSLSEYLADVASPEALENAGSVEALRRTNWHLATLRMWENIYYQWTNGLYEDTEYEAERRIWETSMNYPSVRSVFCMNRTAFSQGFVAELELLMSDPC